MSNEFCPYVGLLPYSEEHWEYFFGRDRDQRIISSNLYSAPLTVLFGSSGVGKSSVLMAGVVPKLRLKPNTAVLVFREHWPRVDFLSVLKSECIKAIGQAQNKPLNISTEMPLDDLLFRAGQIFGGTILVLLDQFEEYFLSHPESEKANSFDAEFARAVNREDVAANFLVILREDSLSNMDRFRARIPNIMGNLLRLNHLDLKAAEDAIRLPLVAYNKYFAEGYGPVSIEGDLVSDVLDQVRPGRVSLTSSIGAPQGQVEDKEIRIETPFLQLVMTRLWQEEMKMKSRVLRSSTLRDKLGGVQNILRTHLDGAMDKLDQSGKEFCAAIFDRLVTPSGAKIACQEDDLIKWAGKLSSHIQPVMKILSENRILRTISEPHGRTTTMKYEIFHDVLGPAVLDWRRRYVEKQEQEKIRQEDREEHARQLEHDRSLRQRKLLAAAAITIILMGFLAIFAYIKSVQKGKMSVLAANQSKRAEQLRRLSDARYERIKLSIQIRQAALEGNLEEAYNLAGLLEYSSSIQFLVTQRDLGYKDKLGREIYRFTIAPDTSSLLKEKGDVAFITYLADHATFKNTLMMAGAKRGFAVSYDGWGCLTKIVALIEYANPEVPPTAVDFDMCRKLLGHN